MGITFGHFAVALIILGLGWNFGFIGGTTHVDRHLSPIGTRQSASRQ